MENCVIDLLLKHDLLVLAGIIIAGLAGGAVGVMVAKPLLAFTRDALGFLFGAALGVLGFCLALSALGIPI